MFGAPEIMERKGLVNAVVGRFLRSGYAMISIHVVAEQSVGYYDYTRCCLE